MRSPLSRRVAAHRDTVLGVVALVAALSLVALVLVGPLLLATTRDVPLGVALSRAVVASSVGYVLLAAALLR